MFSKKTSKNAARGATPVDIDEINRRLNDISTSARLGADYGRLFDGRPITLEDIDEAEQESAPAMG